MQEKHMKRKWIIYSIIFLSFLSYGCAKKNPSANVHFDWRDSLTLSTYIRNSIWSYKDEELIFIDAENFHFVKKAEKDYDIELGKCSKLKSYHIGNHEYRNYPYLEIDGKSYDFIEINEDSFTIAKFDHGKPCTFTRKEKVLETKRGKYQYNGKTYSLYLTDHLGNITDEETNESYQIMTLDSHHFRIEESIFSDTPVYRWWEDEEGNLYLLSEGYDFSGMSNEEIFQAFPVIVLEKID